MNHVITLLLLALAYVTNEVSAQGNDVTLAADSKIGYVVIAILLGLAFIGMFIRIHDVYL